MKKIILLVLAFVFSTIFLESWGQPYGEDSRIISFHGYDQIRLSLRRIKMIRGDTMYMLQIFNSTKNEVGDACTFTKETLMMFHNSLLDAYKSRNFGEQEKITISFDSTTIGIVRINLSADKYKDMFSIRYLNGVFIFSEYEFNKFIQEISKELKPIK